MRVALRLLLCVSPTAAAQPRYFRIEVSVAAFLRLQLDNGAAFDAETSETISLHGNDHVEWNAHRGRFIRFFDEGSRVYVGGTLLSRRQARA